MKSTGFLNLPDVAVDVVVTDKQELLEKLAVRAGARVGLQPERILSELVKREQLVSSGTGGGVAIPHARLNELEKPFALLVCLKRPIDFAAVDSRPVDTVVLLLLPDSSGGGPLSALACVARKLRDPIIMNHLRHARDSVEVYDALTLDSLRHRRPSPCSVIGSLVRAESTNHARSEINRERERKSTSLAMQPDRNAAKKSGSACLDFQPIIDRGELYGYRRAIEALSWEVHFHRHPRSQCGAGITAAPARPPRLARG